MDPRASIYDLSSPLPPDYPWDRRGLSVARRLRAAIWLLRMLTVTTVAIACVWLLGVIEGIGIAAIFGTYAAVVAVALGLRQATLLAFGRRSRTLPPDARHDYTLYAYRWLGKRNKRASSQVLLSIARIDVLRSRPDLAINALGRVDTQLLSPEQLKLFYLLNALAAASTEAGERDDAPARDGIPSASRRDDAVTDPIQPPASRRQPSASDDAATPTPSDDGRQQVPSEPSRPDKPSARDWLVRYSGIAATADRGFPSEQLVEGWVDRLEGGTAGGQADPSPRDPGAADGRRDEAQAAVDGISLSRHAHPLVVAAVSLMLAHCLFYYGLDLGINSGSGWSLRIPYATVASPLAAVFALVLAVMAAVWLFRRGRRDRLATTTTRVQSILGGVAVVTLALVAACGTLLSAAFGYDGTERVLRTGVPDALAGGTVAGGSDSGAHGAPWPLGQRTYDYLAVDWAGFDPDESRTAYYRASDPFLMEPWELAQAYDTARGGQTGASGSGDSAATGSAGDESDAALSTGDPSDGDGIESPSPIDSSDDGDNGTAASGGDMGDSSSASSDDPLGTQNQMLAIARYLDDQGIVPKTDALAFGRNAKGELYASLGTATEELVLQKVYPHGESDTQLVGFYLVDRSTLAVTDEHRTTW
ncbi:MAG: hypothetical protein LIV25_11160 [Olsenella sp.]|nr:hypothetical protein [Olsenella sp.]